MFKRNANCAQNFKVSANLYEKKLYVATDRDIHIYRVEDNDLTFDKSFDGIGAHSIFTINALTVIQEQITNNLRIYNNGALYRTFKGLAPSAPRRSFFLDK